MKTVKTDILILGSGGAGLFFVESTKIERRGCGTVGDLGLWDDAFVPGLRRIADFSKACGAAVGIQLGHSGRKARIARPWEGGRALERRAERHAGQQGRGRLLAQGAVQVGVVMAMDVRPDRGVPVEVALPFPVDQPAALAADQVQARVVLVLPHLGKRMPPEAPVGGVEGVREGRSGCGGSRHTPCLRPLRAIVKPEVGGGLQ